MAVTSGLSSPFFSSHISAVHYKYVRVSTSLSVASTAVNVMRLTEINFLVEEHGNNNNNVKVRAFFLIHETFFFFWNAQKEYWCVLGRVFSIFSLGVMFFLIWTRFFFRKTIFPLLFMLKISEDSSWMFLFFIVLSSNELFFFSDNCLNSS